jgi:2-methylcitrate dehydratase PrpD
MAATQALKEIMADGIAAAEITRIEAAVLPPHLKMIDHGVTPDDRLSQLTSVQYQMALAALAPDAAYDLNAIEKTSSGVATFMARIDVLPDDGLKVHGYPHSWAAHVIIETGSGRRERLVTHVPGDPAQPFGEAELKKKFCRITERVLDSSKAVAMFTSGLAALDDPAAMLHEIDGIAAGD